MSKTTASQRFWTRASDRIATAAISGGGLLMIGSLVLIFILIVSETLPLFAPPKSSLLRTVPVSGASPLAATADEYQEAFALLFPDGTVRALDASGALVKELPVPGLAGSTVSAAARSIKGELALGLANGTAVVATPAWETAFEGEKRRRSVSLSALPPLALDPAGRALTRVAFVARDGSALVAATASAGTLFLGVAATDPADAFARDLSAKAAGEEITALSFLDGGAVLCAGTASGKVLTFPLEDPKSPGAPVATAVHPGSPAPVTALETLLGGQTLVAGDATGRVTGLLRVRTDPAAEARTLNAVKEFEPQGAAITAIAGSPRGKTFVTGDAGGGLVARFGTNARTLVKTRASGPVAAIGVAPKADGFVAVTPKGVEDFSLEAPHPEISFGALFGKVLYEGYDKPEYVWQSSGGTDDFEPKLSLVPLVFGTLKGTFYAMLFAIPIALAAALYTSVFATPRVKRFVKPIVEIMAALPSVVLGFLAGLWLAPLLQKATLSALLMVPMIPLFAVLGVLAFQMLPFDLRQRLHPGQELLLVLPLAVLATGFAAVAGPWVEKVVFAGDFKAWLLASASLKYDARNSLVIAFAMGFAVIPIIFTISEDALSSVPEHLKAASLALGASPWQTAVRVILPTASAGIFSALMVGFGRAVGETMIVLMATGNTPVLDWSIFNGMRTLAANIAVEIPEAPQGGSLYRVLFLAALLLFLVTFLVNTLAEVLRQRLRKKYTVI